MDTLSKKERKQYRRKHGIPREEGVLRDGAAEAPHPSRGGSRGYPPWYRDRMIMMKKLGQYIPKCFCSDRSIRRWVKKGVIPKEMTGNKAKRGMSGHHRFLLALFKKVYPHATNNQCAVFIACHSHDNAVFTKRVISEALKDMGMTRKRASTTAYQAFTPENLELHHRFWHFSFPAGIQGVPRKDLIDVDEMAIELKDANLNYGHAVKGLRVRKIGNYGRGNVKLSLIMAIEAGDPELESHEEGSIDNPRIWGRVSTDAGTSVENYVDFLNLDLMDKFEPNERQRTIMHDNLRSHKADEVVDAIYNRGHRVICRVPYRPHEAPIEFAFDMFACGIRNRWKHIKNEKNLVDECNKLLESKDGLSGFDKLFWDCGYKYNGN